VELVLGIDDEGAVMAAARHRITQDEELDPVERMHVEGAVTEDTAEALAYLVDPFALVGEVPGVELQQASWSSERIDYDPDSPDWEFGEDDDDGGDADDSDDGEGEGGGTVDRREHPGYSG
jgi:hypothetical protein